jgi:predicted GTPase
LQTNIFKVLDGKKLLFDAEESLFNIVRKCQTPVILPREKIASSMKKEEIHQDVSDFFEKLRAFTA